MSVNLFLFIEQPRITSIEELKLQIDLSLETKQLALKHGDHFFCNLDETYDAVCQFGTICELCYNSIEGLDKEYQIKLSILVERNNPVDHSCKEIDVINELYSDDYNSLFGFEEERLSTIHDVDTWYKFHRDYYIIYPPLRRAFCESLQPFFPNIYLNPASIPPGLNGFSNPDYNQVMKTILYHLTALNDVYFKFFKNGYSGDEACNELENLYKGSELKIEASRDNNTSKDLQIQFADETGAKREFYCDLHTKFCQYFEFDSPSPEQRSKRIYFEFPQTDFLGNRILIGMIGKHRS